MADQEVVRTILELDLAAYSDVARALEENLNVSAVKAFEDQIQSFVNIGLQAVALDRADVLFGTAGDNAVLIFDRPDVMHEFAQAVHNATVTHNQSRTVEAAKRWFRMGAATGTVLILESERRIVGSTVARAIRLEATSRPGELVIDLATYSALSDNAKTRYGAEELVQGKRDETFPARRCPMIPDDLIRTVHVDAIRQASQEIASLALHSATQRQRQAVNATVRDCLDSLRRIQRGQIPIPGKEAGYFKRLLERVETAAEPEHIRAFIRLTPFDPAQLAARSWFETVYRRFEQEVHRGRLAVDYIFLLRTPTPIGRAKDFIAKFEGFAGSIALLDQHDSRLTPDMLRPSIVLLEKQRVAFTHDRADDSSLLEPIEWLFEEDYKILEGRYKRLELLSTAYLAKGKHSTSK